MNEINTIDSLQENGICFFIDILPQKMESASFFNLEEYLLQSYIIPFSKKISEIAIKLTHYYRSKILFFPRDSDTPPKDLTNVALQELSTTIANTIREDKDSIQILINLPSPFLMSINGGFSVDFYFDGQFEEQIKLITLLATQENLFFRKET